MKNATFNATYICRCGDGVNRMVEGNTREQVDAILARARKKFQGVQIEDVVAEIRRNESDSDETDSERGNDEKDPCNIRLPVRGRD